MVAFCPPEFLVNVTLNADKATTKFFAGHYFQAHRMGCEHVRQHAMTAVPQRFPIVVTSNNGYPLDQNVYQAVKGMSAAARIVGQNGTVIIVSECRDGVPDHGNFGEMLRAAASIDDADARLQALPDPVLDQWEVQALLGVRRKCDVALYSSLEPGTVRDCLLTPVGDPQTEVEDRVRSLGGRPPVAVLPEGPVTIPYVVG
jgi:nickel-dependent lactate racemase